MTAGSRRELYRWGLSGAVVLAAHLAAVVYVLSRPGQTPPSAPPAAIVIDLAPIAASPDVPETNLPPEPEQPDIQPEPEPEPIPQPVPEIEEQPIPDPVEDPPPPETPPVAEPEVPLPPPPPPEKKPETKVEPEPEKIEPPKKKPPQKPSEARAPRPVAAPKAQAAAPALSSAERPSNAIPNWRSLVAAMLERNKRYPPEARSRGDRGTANVRFTIDRAGRLVGASLVGSSGSAALDQEAVALVRRAQPFPPPPPEVRGGTITIVVPVRFNIR